MKILTEYLAENFLEEEGFKIVQRILTHNKDQALNAAKHIGFPVVLKISSNSLLHKSEKNAVKLDIKEENFSKTYDELDLIKIEKQGIIVQKYINGKFILLGLKKDPTFGHIILVCVGGIYTEIIKDTAMRITPINKNQALEMVKELKSYKILGGFRGEKVNINLIVEALLKLSKISQRCPSIKELDINPLIVNENSAEVVDARIIFD